MDEGSDGPFGGPLTDNQKTALQNELGALADAFNGLLAAQAENGRLSKDVASAATRQQGNLDSLNGAVGDIVNVDLAAVAVKLNQAQFAYQASAGVFSTIKGLSLLNYLSPPTS
jgi:flagellar hook-associated protein 3 FlgL